MVDKLRSYGINDRRTLFEFAKPLVRTVGANVVVDGSIVVEDDALLFGAVTITSPGVMRVLGNITGERKYMTVRFEDLTSTTLVAFLPTLINGRINRIRTVFIDADAGVLAGNIYLSDGVTRATTNIAVSGAALVGDTDDSGEFDPVLFYADASVGLCNSSTPRYLEAVVTGAAGNPRVVAVIEMTEGI